ncbi:MAG TPA: hypothetical protein VGN64_21915 [Dyadobacter sp.]|nr:hypothetical protein [Dyadobacter sp.]
MKATLKQCIALGLLGLMLVKAWVIPLLYLDFEIRRDYIVANLCENKNRPQLNCNGKCYLAKKIEAAKKQEQRQAEQDYMASLIYQVMNTNHHPYLKVEVPFKVISDKIPFDYASPFTAFLLADDIFHPPLV